MAAVRMADLPTTGTDVLVVGAGPTGLMAGLMLRNMRHAMVIYGVMLALLLGAAVVAIAYEVDPRLGAPQR